MRCRKIYKNDNNNTYSITFFKSKGLTYPNSVKFGETEISTTDLPDTITGTFEFSDITISYTIKYIGPNKYSTVLTWTETSISESVILPIYANFGFSKYLTLVKEYKLHDYEQQRTLEIPFNILAVSIKDTENYAEKQEGVACGLIQRISVIKGELWWMINYGLPLLDKIRNKAIFDSVLINIILKHPDVKNIISLNSHVVNHEYYFEAKINTVFNEAVQISNFISGLI